MDSDVLVCTNEPNFFHIEYSRFKPYFTIWDNHILKNNYMDIKEFIRELSTKFKKYPYILHDYHIVIQLDDETKTIDKKVVSDELMTNPNIDLMHDIILASDKDQLMTYLFNLSVKYNIADVLECKITMEKWSWSQQIWEPNIPIITGKKTPKRKINRKKLSGTLKQHILSRDNATCQHCGVDIVEENGVKAHYDHIIPVSKGGPDEPWNLQILCDKCNLEKHNNGKLKIDHNKLDKLQHYYNIPGKLEKVKGQWNYYDDEKITGKFSRDKIKNFG